MIFIFSILVLAGVEGAETRKPNILFILADDLGYNDVSWHNPEMPTLGLEKLAREGVILEQAYTQQVLDKCRKRKQWASKM